MKNRLNQEEIGRRIAHLRKSKGFSQEELAKRVDISRSSLAQIELGKRNISILEIREFSAQLHFSIDDFMADDFDLDNMVFKSTHSDTEQTERISTPIFNLEKFANVLLYVLERCAGKPNVGETVLYKLLYFSDFNYYEIYEKHLSGAVYRKLPYGPVPHKLDRVIKHMIDSSQLKRIKTEYHTYSQTRYLPLVKPDLSLLKASETQVIDSVIEQFSSWSAKALSDYSHKDMPWVASKEGQEINYELAFYREAPFSARTYNDDE